MQSQLPVFLEIISSKWHLQEKKSRKNSLPIPRSHKLHENPTPANNLGIGLTLAYPPV